jgi:predicted nucleotidyltransferase
MAQKQLPDDFKDFLDSLNRNKVKYLLLGGWAVGIYGAPRATADLDVFIAVDDKNVAKLQAALYEFGAPTVPKEHFKEIGRVFRMGRSPIRIEIINQASGIDFKSCYARRQTITVDGTPITLISQNDLVTNKAASGRDKDRADLKNLRSIQKQHSLRKSKNKKQ